MSSSEAKYPSKQNGSILVTLEAKLLFMAAESLTFESVGALTPGTRRTRGLILTDEDDIWKKNEDDLWTETGLDS